MRNVENFGMTVEDMASSEWRRGKSRTNRKNGAGLPTCAACIRSSTSSSSVRLRPLLAHQDHMGMRIENWTQLTTSCKAYNGSTFSSESRISS